MIAISETLIRSARRLSQDEEKSPALGPEPSSLEHLLSHSPPALSPISHDFPDESTSKSDSKAPEPPRHKPPKEDTVPPLTRMASPSFTKEPVKPKARLLKQSSSLSKELKLGAIVENNTGYNRNDRYTSGPLMKLEVFVMGQAPFKIRLPGSTTVEDVIDLIIREHTAQRRKPALSPDSDLYELRMVDDDDGTPDDDLPPLDPNRMISQTGVDAVALCEKDQPVAPSVKVEGPDGRRLKRGVSLELNLRSKSGKMFLKVHMPNHVSHVLPVTADMQLEEVIPLVSKKRTANDEKITPQTFKFTLLGETNALDMSTPIGDIRSDEVRLVRRVKQDTELASLGDSEPHISQPNILLTHDIAHQYNEYPVIKTNQRGKKQKRVLGIDGDKIYNRNPDQLDVLGRKISMDVRRAFRYISELVSADILRDGRSFRFTFRDQKGNMESRDYEADTKMDCQQIVAKVKWLMNERKSLRPHKDYI